MEGLKQTMTIKSYKVGGEIEKFIYLRFCLHTHERLQMFSVIKILG